MHSSLDAGNNILITHESVVKIHLIFRRETVWALQVSLLLWGTHIHAFEVSHLIFPARWMLSSCCSSVKRLGWELTAWSAFQELLDCLNFSEDGVSTWELTCLCSGTHHGGNEHVAIACSPCLPYPIVSRQEGCSATSCCAVYQRCMYVPSPLLVLGVEVTQQLMFSRGWPLPAVCWMLPSELSVPSKSCPCGHCLERCFFLPSCFQKGDLKEAEEWISLSH